MRPWGGASVLALAAVSAAVAAPLPASYRDIGAFAQRTYFATCLEAINGSLDMSDAAQMGKAGLRRAPAELDKKMTHPRYGQPQLAVAVMKSNVISMAIYPATSLCSVMLQGPDRASGFAAIRQRILSSPTIFTADPEQSNPRDDFAPEAFKLRLEDGTNFRAMLMKPPQSDSAPAFIATIGWTKD